MFTGIIRGLGWIKSFDEASHLLTVACPEFLARTIKMGASIAVDGVCLTVSMINPKALDEVGFHLGQETRSITLLTQKPPGEMVNVEFALGASDALDGHLVQGHVDGVATLVRIIPTEEGMVFYFSLPKNLLPLVVKKGSIALDGVSLTINEVTEDGISVCLVPYTLAHTSFNNKKIGALVHIETDIVGRYLNRFYQTTPNIFTTHTEGIRS